MLPLRKPGARAVVRGIGACYTGIGDDMTMLIIPPDRVEDVDRVKDFLFVTMGASPWDEAAYLAYADRFPQLVELSDGRLVVLDMPTPAHQRIVQHVFRCLDTWCGLHDGEAFVAPMPVRLWPGKFREPDVMVYTAGHRDRVRDDYGGPPDLVVEVQSPGTARLDAHDKVREYAQAGIPEYWRIDLERRSVEINVLDGDAYVMRALIGDGEPLASVTIPELVCRPADWFADAR
jgi:Uma2 family endonuclease